MSTSKPEVEPTYLSRMPAKLLAEVPGFNQPDIVNSTNVKL